MGYREHGLVHHLEQLHPDVLAELGGKHLQEVAEEPDGHPVGLAAHEALGVDGGYLQIGLAEVVGEAPRESGHEVPPQILHPEVVPGLLFGIVLGQLVVGVGELEVKDADELLLVSQEIDYGLVDEINILLPKLLVFRIEDADRTMTLFRRVNIVIKK